LVLKALLRTEPNRTAPAVDVVLQAQHRPLPAAGGGAIWQQCPARCWRLNAREQQRSGRRTTSDSIHDEFLATTQATAVHWACSRRLRNVDRVPDISAS